MSLDVADWLRGLGLEQYASAFRDSAIDVEVLPSLTAEDLRDIGVTFGRPSTSAARRHRAPQVRSQLNCRSRCRGRARPHSRRRRPPTIHRCRTSATDRHVLRSRRLDSTFDPARSRGTEQRPRRVSKGMRQRRDRVWRLGCQVYGRWSARLFRLSGGPRGRCRAGRPRRACADRRDGGDATVRSDCSRRSGSGSPPAWSWWAS